MLSEICLWLNTAVLSSSVPLPGISSHVGKISQGGFIIYGFAASEYPFWDFPQLCRDQSQNIQNTSLFYHGAPTPSIKAACPGATCTHGPVVVHCTKKAGGTVMKKGIKIVCLAAALLFAAAAGTFAGYWLGRQHSPAQTGDLSDNGVPSADETQTFYAVSYTHLLCLLRISPA